MAQEKVPSIQKVVIEAADAYNEALLAEREKEEKIDLTWTLIRDVMETQGQGQLLDQWLLLQDELKPLVTDRNKTKAALTEAAEQAARGWHTLALGRFLHPLIDIKNSLRVSMQPEYQHQLRVVEWLVERGWGGLVVVKLPGGDWKLGTGEPKAADWKNEQNFPRTAFGIPLLLVNETWPKPYIDNTEKWLLAADVTTEVQE